MGCCVVRKDEVWGDKKLVAGKVREDVLNREVQGYLGHQPRPDESYVTIAPRTVHQSIDTY